MNEPMYLCAEDMNNAPVYQIGQEVWIPNPGFPGAMSDYLPGQIVNYKPQAGDDPNWRYEVYCADYPEETVWMGQDDVHGSEVDLANGVSNPSEPLRPGKPMTPQAVEPTEEY